MFVAMRLMRKLETEEGMTLKFPTEGGCIGVLPVFEKATDALDVYGTDCEVVEVRDAEGSAQ